MVKLRINAAGYIVTKMTIGPPTFNNICNYSASLPFKTQIFDLSGRLNTSW